MKDSIVCKLTNFDDVRPGLIQTQTILLSKVKNIEGGSPTFMTAEILLPGLRPSEALMNDLKILGI